VKNWILGTTILAAMAAGIGAAPADAQDIPPKLIEEVRSWMTDPTVLITVRQWNETHASLTQAEIDELDQKWRAEVGTGKQPLIAQITGAPLSNFLMRKKAKAGGRLIEAFVMDSKGLNVGVSSITSDYWQGDEAKFQQTFDKGPNAIHYGEIEVKDDTGHRAQQVNMTIVDPETGKPIGAMTVEFDLNVVALYEAGS